MEARASATERLSATVELVEMIIAALPLRDMLLVRPVSRTWRDLVRGLPSFKHARSKPTVDAKLLLPSACSLSSTEPPKLSVTLELRFDRPVTFRRVTSVLGSKLSTFTYRIEEGAAHPTTFPRFSLGGRFKSGALAFSHENAWKYTTLLPGTPHELVWSFGRNENPWLRDDVSLKNIGLNDTVAGKSYILAMRPDLSLPAFLGTKTSLLTTIDAGENLKELSFFQHFGHGLPVVGGDPILFKVIP